MVNQRPLHSAGWQPSTRGLGRTRGNALMMKAPLLGEFTAPKDNEHWLGPLQRIDAPMKHYEHDDEVDYVIIGVGSAGGVLVQRLAKAGFRVVGIEAGPFLD